MGRLRRAEVRLERGLNMERLHRWGHGQKSTHLERTRQLQISLIPSTIFIRTRRTTSAPWFTAGVRMCWAYLNFHDAARAYNAARDQRSGTRRSQIRVSGDSARRVIGCADCDINIRNEAERSC